MNFMIQHFPQRVILKGGTASGGSLDLEHIEKLLVEALNDCAIQERWLVDHVLVALQDYTAMIADATERVDRQTLNTTVARMLVDAGYPDVAVRFAERARINDAVVDTEGKTGWDSERIEKILREHLSTVEHLIPRLESKVRNRLEKLGFRRVGDELVLELARHVLVEWSDHERREEKSGGDEWLMTAGFWQAFFASETAEMLEDNVLEIRRVSELLPVARLRLSLDSLVLRCPDKPRTELELRPLLVRKCRLVGHAVEVLRGEIAARYSVGRSHPPHLLITGLERMLNLVFPESRKSWLARRRDEYVNLISTVLEKEARQRVIVAFTDTSRNSLSE